MDSLTVLRRSANDLWADAVVELRPEDKSTINVSQDTLKVLADLHGLTEKAKKECSEKKWKYARKSGAPVVLRDVFDKILRWVDIFEEVHSGLVQYNSQHATLPWAGITFVLQMAVSDSKKFGEVIEGIAWIAEIICRHSIVEGLYLNEKSEATKELRRALVKLYAAVLTYLSKAKHYLEQHSAKSRLKSGLLNGPDFGAYMHKIHQAEANVSEFKDLIERHDQLHNRKELVSWLAKVDAPLQRTDATLENIQDDLKASKRTEILQWISLEPYIQHHNQAKHDVLEGTGRWLLSDPIFVKWREESVSSILWLHGIPGSGKSKLVSTVIEETYKRFHTGFNPQPIFFYCSRNGAEPGRSDPKAILASLAKQLSCTEPGKPLLKPTIDLHTEKEDEGFASGPLEIEESCELIINLAKHYPLTTIVLDALDECDPGKRLILLGSLKNILQKSSGLVKVLISSRDDHDLVLRLQEYPNIDINSDRNSEDIELFVRKKTEELIGNRELLQYSDSKPEMRELIVKRVTEGARGMFRWASMQLQYLCSFVIDTDICECLGRLPPELNTLYTELYNVLANKPGESERNIFQNVLSWLLSAQETLKTPEFLKAVSYSPRRGSGVSPVSKDAVLKLCNNFIVHDAHLDTFRFAHLSVREFLEQRDEYATIATNALMAEACLWNLISNNGQGNFLPVNQGFCQYSDIYWAEHYRMAGCRRTSSHLQEFLRHLIHDEDRTNSIVLWSYRFPSKSRKYHLDRKLRERLRDSRSGSGVILFVSCAFDFPEILRKTRRYEQVNQHLLNRDGRNLLQVAIRHGSFASLKVLLDQYGSVMKVTLREVGEAAATKADGNKIMMFLVKQWSEIFEISDFLVAIIARSFNSNIMGVLCDRRGDEIQFTPGVVKAAAENRFGKAMMEFLFTQRAVDINITPGVVKAAAKNESGKEILEFLFDQRADEINITLEVIEAAARNGRGCGNDVVMLLVERRGEMIEITNSLMAIITKSFDQKVIELLLKKRPGEIKITESVVEAAARNTEHGKEIMVYLLEKYPETIEMSNGLIAIVIKSFDEEVMELLLKKLPNEIEIAECVVEAAATDGKEKMNLLLGRLRNKIRVTPLVIEAAWENSDLGNVLKLLCETYPDEIQGLLGEKKFERLTPTCFRVKHREGWLYVKHCT